MSGTVSPSDREGLPLDPEVAALLRRFFDLDHIRRLTVAELIGSHLAAAAQTPGVEERVALQREALTVLSQAAAELDLEPGKAPTTRAFNSSLAAQSAGWNAARVIRLFGRWDFAIDRLVGRSGRQTAEQRAAERASRRGVYREREDYLRGLRLWLESCPISLTTADYDGWKLEYNRALPPGGALLVSYSMLRKAFKCDWPDLLDVARGRISLAAAEARSKRASLSREEGPHRLIGFSEVRELLGLSTTSARNATRKSGFPPPVYVHPRGARQRLWRRSDVEQFVGGETGWGEVDCLQDEYLDAHAVAAQLGVAPITVTTGSSPRVPQPSVRLAGLQLWLRRDIERICGSENDHHSAEGLSTSANDQSHRTQPPHPQHHPSDRRTALG